MTQNPETVNDQKITREVTINGQIFIIEGTVELSITPKGGTVPDPEKPPINPEKPSDFGTIKQGDKWTANPGKAETWTLKQMDNPSTEFKFISIDGKNIIANIKSEDQASILQNYFKVNVFPPKIDGGTVDDTELLSVANEPVPEGQLGPYPLKGKTYESKQRGPTCRHYASGAPDDWTIEKNVEDIESGNHQMICDISVPEEMEHDDNLSIKIGGNHMDNGWFDNGISLYEGQSCLGTEVKHPKTKKCIIKGKKYGDLRGKRVQVASCYFIAENKTEYWIKMPGASWDKAAEGKDVGGFNSKTKEGKFGVQLRIDGFKSKNTPPEIHSAIVQEI